MSAVENVFDIEKYSNEDIILRSSLNSLSIEASEQQQQHLVK